MSSITGSPGSAELENFTLRDIMAELKKLATKEEVVQVKGTLIAQSAEIQQLRSELDKHNERIKVLETEAGVRVARESNSAIRPDVYNPSRKQYGSAQSDRSSMQQQRRQNIVIHCLNVKNDDELMENILDLCQAMGALVFASDVEEIVRLGHSDSTGPRAAPIRVTFQFQYIRNNVLQKKLNLLKKAKYASVFISADEPIEVQRMKGIFPRIAYRAREEGKTVSHRANWIQIGDNVYQASDLDSIPRKYMPDDPRRSNARRGMDNGPQVDSVNAGAEPGTPLLAGSP